MEKVRELETYLRDRDFPLALVHVRRQKEMAPHSHDFTELVYVARGKGIHLLGENRFIIGESNIFLIPPGVEHGYGETESLELYNILFSGEEFISGSSDMDRLAGYELLFNMEPLLRGSCSDRRTLFVEKRLVIDPLEKLESWLEAGSEGWRYVSRHLFDRILFHAVTDYLPLPRNSLLDRLSRVMPYIRENLGEDLTLSRICAEAGMSRSALTRTFHRVYGMSPMKKVGEMKIEKAKALLRDPGLQIQDVADLCGFASAAYFCRVFREHTGRTASRFRERGCYGCSSL